MTTIGPQKKRQSTRVFLACFLGTFVLGAVLGISFYNDTVDLKHEVRKAEARIVELEVLNADVKNQLYALLDAERLEALAGELGFVLEKRPSYLRVGASDLATNL